MKLIARLDGIRNIVETLFLVAEKNCGRGKKWK
jgi:hypothetical protein